MLKKYYHLLFFLFFGIGAQASHYAGYDMSITSIPGGDTYKIKFTIYKDNAGGTAPMPTTMSFKTYVNGTNMDAGLNFSTPRVDLYLATYNPADCPPASATLALQVGIFEYTLTAAQALSLTNPSGYYFSKTECCRNVGSTNVINSEGISINFSLDLPSLGPSSLTRYNSSPRFNKIPLTFYCIGKPYTIDWECTDPDGDSLVYSLLRPTDGSTSTKPFGYGTYAPGYNFNYNIIDGSPDLTINPKTGIINFIPTKTGRYLIGFKVDEYRKISGVPKKIGTIYREFLIETVLCFDSAPVLASLNSNNVQIMDTITDVYDSAFTYTRDFIAHEILADSLFMSIQWLNITDTTFNHKLKWGYPDTLQSGSNIQDYIVKGKSPITGRFEIVIDSLMARQSPYAFRVFVQDKTCPSPLSDFIDVYLFVKEKNCSPVYKNYTIYGCDSALGNNGKWYYTQGLNSDTVVQADGCLLITNYNVNLHTNIVHYYLGSCDSVKGLGNNYYYSSGIYIDTIKNNLCDTINVFHVNVNLSPLTKEIIGDTIVSSSTEYQYFFTPDPGNNTAWSVVNGTILTSNMFSALVKWDTLFNNGSITATEMTANGCDVENKLNVKELKSGIFFQKSDFKIYPNPSSHIIRIENNSVVNEIPTEIFDIQGVRVKSFMLFKSNEIDISDLPTGVYFIRIGENAYKMIKY